MKETTQNPEVQSRSKMAATEANLKESPYMKRLQSSESDEQLEQLHATKEAYFQLESDIMAQEKAIMKADRKIEELTRAKDYKPTEIIKQKHERNNLYLGLEALYELREEDFGV